MSEVSPLFRLHILYVVAAVILNGDQIIMSRFDPLRYFFLLELMYLFLGRCLYSPYAYGCTWPSYHSRLLEVSYVAGTTQ